MYVCPCLFYDSVAVCFWKSIGLNVNTIIITLICFRFFFVVRVYIIKLSHWYIFQSIPCMDVCPVTRFDRTVWYIGNDFESYSRYACFESRLTDADTCVPRPGLKLAVRDDMRLRSFRHCYQ
jgi:hypothetical protein